eukprot:jgi/Bigna1/83574/fgenesh1_pg.110_\
MSDSKANSSNDDAAAAASIVRITAANKIRTTNRKSGVDADWLVDTVFNDDDESGDDAAASAEQRPLNKSAKRKGDRACFGAFFACVKPDIAAKLKSVGSQFSGEPVNPRRRAKNPVSQTTTKRLALPRILFKCMMRLRQPYLLLPAKTEFFAGAGGSSVVVVCGEDDSPRSLFGGLKAFLNSESGNTSIAKASHDAKHQAVDPAYHQIASSYQFGFLPRLLHQIYSYIDEKAGVLGGGEDDTMKVRLGMCDLVGDDYFDLLDPENNSAIGEGAAAAPGIQPRPVKIRESSDGDSYIENQIWYTVKSWRSAMKVLLSGMTCRDHLASSSGKRSKGGNKEREDYTKTSTLITSISFEKESGKAFKLYAVGLPDLVYLKANAGNDRALMKTNLGLSCLNGVLTQLASSSSSIPGSHSESSSSGGSSNPHQHIPYRDSNITHLLRNGLKQGVKCVSLGDYLTVVIRYII